MQLTARACAKDSSRCKQSSVARNGSLYTCHGRLVAGVYEWVPTNYLFNGLTQIKGWSDVAPMVGNDEWVLFLEDDVSVHPSMEPLPTLAVPRAIAGALAASAEAGHGIAYFGLCGPVCSNTTAFASSGQVSITHDGHLDTTLRYKPCTGSCGHAYAMRGEALRALSRQARRTIARVQQQHGGSAGLGSPASSSGLCEAYVACLHDPFGAHEMLRQGCDSFNGGWLDAATGRGPIGRLTRGGAGVKAIKLPDLKVRWQSIKVCGNLYGHDLEGPCKKGHFGLFYQNRALLKSNHATKCI